jgi:hypothetical protein
MWWLMTSRDLEAGERPDTGRSGTSFPVSVVLFVVVTWGKEKQHAFARSRRCDRGKGASAAAFPSVTSFPSLEHSFTSSLIHFHLHDDSSPLIQHACAFTAFFHAAAALVVVDFDLHNISNHHPHNHLIPDMISIL